MSARLASLLDDLLPTPRLREVDGRDVAAPSARVWERMRHGTLGSSRAIRALFALRTLPTRLRGDEPEPLRLRLDDMRSTPEVPGFQILVEAPPREVAVGAIGEVYRLDIPFVHVDGADAFRAFDRPGQIKVAWAIRVEPRGTEASHVAIEVRVDATDEAAWRRFRRYFRVIGPASRFIRRSLLSGLARELGGPAERSRAELRPG